MGNISDVIERYLKHILQESPDQSIEIRRNDLAAQFDCVPSQINYVIRTRFTVERGYLVQSKRGGHGFIRIQKLLLPSTEGLFEHFFKTIGGPVDQAAAEGIIYQLEDAEVITAREANVFRAVTSRESLPFPLPIRDEVRGKLLKAMILSLFQKEGV